MNCSWRELQHQLHVPNHPTAVPGLELKALEMHNVESEVLSVLCVQQSSTGHQKSVPFYQSPPKNPLKARKKHELSLFQLQGAVGDWGEPQDF